MPSTSHLTKKGEGLPAKGLAPLHTPFFISLLNSALSGPPTQESIKTVDRQSRGLRHPAHALVGGIGDGVDYESYLDRRSQRTHLL